MRSTSCTGARSQTRIPHAVLVGLAAASVAAACAIGIVVALRSTLWLLVFVAFGAFVVAAYNLELFGGAFHSDVWFAVAWGAFPVLTAYFASARAAAGRGGRRRRVRPDVEPRAAAAVDAGAPRATAGRVGRRARCASRTARDCRSTPSCSPGRRRRRSRRSRPGWRCWPRRFCSSAPPEAVPWIDGADDDSRPRLRRRHPRRRSVARPGSVPGGVPAGARRRHHAPRRPARSRPGSSFALHQPRERQLAVAAAGLVVCASPRRLGPAAARAPALRRRRRPARGLAGAAVRARRREAAERAAELERMLARARADSVSLLAEEERRIAEERRREFAERERDVDGVADGGADAHAGAGRAAARRVGAGPRPRRRGDQGADRGADGAPEAACLRGRASAHRGRRQALGRERRAARRLARLRSELDKALGEALAAAQAELESHAAERRRALHELDDRMRAAGAGAGRAGRARGGRGGAAHPRPASRTSSRRQVEHMERVVARATTAYAEEAAQQFATVAKAAREEAARRLGRELDLAVERVRPRGRGRPRRAARARRRRRGAASRAPARRGDEGTRAPAGRVDRRARPAIADLEADVRRRLEELNADADAERGVLEARLQELMRRLDADSAVQRSS